MDSEKMRVLHEAFRRIHEHGHGSLHERLFEALDLLFEDSSYGLELFGTDGSYAIETTLPFDQCKDPEFTDRTGELVRAQNPMFARLVDGEKAPMRLSDLITMRQLRRTDLFHEIFMAVDIRSQIGIPIQSQSCLGGLTLNRGRGDYTQQDLAIAAILAPQIATAFEAEQYIKNLQPAVQEAAQTDFSSLRRMGLSHREAEVMNWLTEGKRDAEIATILNISVRTVHQHVRAILTKLRVETRTNAVAMVLRNDRFSAAKRAMSAA